MLGKLLARLATGLFAARPAGAGHAEAGNNDIGNAKVGDTGVRDISAGSGAGQHSADTLQGADTSLAADVWQQRAAVQAAAGNLQAAAATYQAALREHADNPALRVNASNVLKQLGRTAEAREQLELAVKLSPALSGAWYNLAILLQETQWFDEAVDAYDRVLALERAGDDPLHAKAVIGKGLSLQSAGRYLDARAFLGSMAEKYPALASDCLRNALFTWVEDPTATPQQRLAAHREWGTRFADPLTPTVPAFANVADADRRLRIGYVSGDLRAHAVSYFFESLLEYHDRSSFSVHCYDNTAHVDATSAVLQSWPAEWRQVASLDDEALASMIRMDDIDILIDLSGHTSRNRLDAFARKPAPVQATWLGYPMSSGMLAMDYRITDAIVDPPGISESWYAERLVRIPGSQWCFREPHNSPDVGNLPLLRNGHVTFGSFNQLGKLNAQVLDTWAALLHALPGSRLAIARVPMGRRRDAFLEQWQSRGIESQRLTLHGYVNRDRFLALHQEADIALDPFPCPGGTTSCESLWMGLPVVVMDGPAGVARAGTSIMKAAGLADWVAKDSAAYIELAIAKAGDAQGLARLRHRMRERLRASALMDGATFTRNFESALRQMWRDWCAR